VLTPLYVVNGYLCVFDFINGCLCINNANGLSMKNKSHKSKFTRVLFKIYTGDYSEEGYSKGFSDRSNGRPQQGWGVFRINPVNFLWKFGESADSFNRNYRDGYLDRQRVENEVYKESASPAVSALPNKVANSDTKLEGKIMGVGQDSYQNQLRLIRHARNELQTFRRHLRQLVENYQQQIRAAESSGYMQNMIEPLRSRCSKFNQKVDELDRLISQHDNVIEEHENKVVHLMNNANG